MKQLLGVLLAIAGIAVMADRASAQTARRLAARFRVLVPADAIVFIANERMRTQGTERLFQSPPLPVGRAYRYEFKAVWRGKEVVREVRFMPGRTVEVDFRPDFGKLEPAEEPPASPFRRIKPWAPPTPRYA